MRDEGGSIWQRNTQVMTCDWELGVPWHVACCGMAHTPCRLVESSARAASPSWHEHPPASGSIGRQSLPACPTDTPI